MQGHEMSRCGTSIAIDAVRQYLQKGQILWSGKAMASWPAKTLAMLTTTARPNSSASQNNTGYASPASNADTGADALSLTLHILCALWTLFWHCNCHPSHLSLGPVLKSIRWAATKQWFSVSWTALQDVMSAGQSPCYELTSYQCSISGNHHLF